MKFIIPTILFLLFFLQGCSAKNSLEAPKIEKQNKISLDKKEYLDSEDDTSEFDDEFEEEIEIYDPLSTYNRFMTTFNDKLFTYLLSPISKGYAYVIPNTMRTGISNTFHNIKFPIRFANNILQGKFQNATDELERFIVNSTVGLAGLFDPAKKYMHINPHNEDFGQTLGYYGMGTGIHVVIPLLGPSNIRDMVGLTADGYLSPILYQEGIKRYKIPQNYTEAVAIYSLETINKNSLHLGAYESLKKDAIDLYPFLRDIYEQKRISDIEK
jgi:phospholipid-binding lipoprotein MlaA